jgi:hypothetical protein
MVLPLVLLLLVMVMKMLVWVKARVMARLLVREMKVLLMKVQGLVVALPRRVWGQQQVEGYADQALRKWQQQQQLELLTEPPGPWWGPWPTSCLIWQAELLACWSQ